MKTIISMAAVVGILSAAPTVVVAVPADGAAIARLGQQVDVLLVAKKTKKPKTKTTGTPTPPPPEPNRSY